MLPCWIINRRRLSVPDRELHEHNNGVINKYIVIVDAIRQRDPDKAIALCKPTPNSVSAYRTRPVKVKKCGSDRTPDPLV